MIRIKNIEALEILDSRGNPTIEVEVELEDKSKGSFMVPSGASTGSYEACELRDKDNSRYNGKGVLNAVNNVNTIIKNKLIGMDASNQELIDNTLIELDGTNNKSRLGANAILGVSVAVLRAYCNSRNIEVYEYFGGSKLPIPMMNVLNGGKHSDNNISSQEFMIMPINMPNFKEGLRMCADVYHTLKKILKDKKLSTGVGDEGGFAPNLESEEECLDLLVEAIKEAGYIPGKDFKLCLDIASTEMWEEAKKIGKNGYLFWKTNKFLSPKEMILWQEKLTTKYPIFSIEDGLAEEDWDNWKEYTLKIGNRIQLVGDDLFVTNIERLKKGIDLGVCNSILIKLNQIGTITETIKAINLAKENKYTYIISHRSGETEDNFIADLATGLSSGQIKTGAPCRSDRVSKYNRLLKIENKLLKNQ